MLTYILYMHLQMYMYSTYNYVHLYCTTRYAAQRIHQLEEGGKLTRRSCFRKWYATTITEMQGFLAIIFNMGLIQLPQLEDYWKTSWVTEVPFFIG